MQFRQFAFAVLVAMASVVARGAPLPTDGDTAPAKAADLSKTFALGRAMFEQNQQVHAAQYVMRKFAPGSAAHAAVPLITTTGGVNRVRFARSMPAGPEVFFQVDFRPHSAPAGFAPSDTALTADEAVQFKARALVLAAIANRCLQDYDTIVLKNPDGDGWLVWALGTSSDDGQMVVGVHYRFRISADGTTDLRHEVMAPVCGTYDVGQTPRMRLADLRIVETVASQPTEIHVMQSLARNIPIYVATTVNRKLWVVQPYGFIMFVRDLN